MLAEQCSTSTTAKTKSKARFGAVLRTAKPQRHDFIACDEVTGYAGGNPNFPTKNAALAGVLYGRFARHLTVTLSPSVKSQSSSRPALRRSENELLWPLSCRGNLGFPPASPKVKNNPAHRLTAMSKCTHRRKAMRPKQSVNLEYKSDCFTHMKA